MDFKFNFAAPDAIENDEKTDLRANLISETEEMSNISYGTVQNIDISAVDQNYLNTVLEKYRTIQIGNHILKYLPSSTVVQVKDWLRHDSALRLSEDSQSDLLPGIYEGGLKLWECALDLMHFLHENNCLLPNAKVLELGCGAGLPAILAYLSGCHVTFQDYNVEVLELATIPNALLNTPQDKKSQISQSCSFIAGDWHNIHKKYCADYECKKFDVILTSETIYEKQNHEKLLNLMKCVLEPDGVIYLAAKTHYFGVGGTLDDFKHLIMTDGSFSWDVLKTTCEGVQKVIVQMRFKIR